MAFMILFSNSLFAGIGDVYYCEMTQFTGIKDLEDLPTSDILSNVQIDDFMRKGVESNSAITDEKVGLAEESKSADLPLDETFVEVDWQKENIESDALLETTEGEL